MHFRNHYLLAIQVFFSSTLCSFMEGPQHCVTYASTPMSYDSTKIFVTLETPGEPSHEPEQTNPTTTLRDIRQAIQDVWPWTRLSTRERRPDFWVDGTFSIVEVRRKKPKFCAKTEAERRDERRLETIIYMNKWSHGANARCNFDLHKECPVRGSWYSTRKWLKSVLEPRKDI